MRTELIRHYNAVPASNIHVLIEGKRYQLSFDSQQVFYNTTWHYIHTNSEGDKYIKLGKVGKTQYIVAIDKEEIKEPLYKILNKERTQGEWYNIHWMVKSQWQGNEGKNGCFISDGKYQFNKPEGYANAEYTALSVNNLHVVAETLEDVLTEYCNACKLLAEATGMVWSENNISIKAKEALNKIS